MEEFTFWTFEAAMVSVAGGLVLGALFQSDTILALAFIGAVAFGGLSMISGVITAWRD